MRKMMTARAMVLISSVALTLLIGSPVFCQQPAKPEKPEAAVLFKGVKVFDGKSDNLTAETSVLVVGNKITKIGGDIKAPENAVVIDAKGRTMTPGFIDAHVHLQWNVGVREFLDGPVEYHAALALAEAKRTLMRGYTTVRDTGGGVHGIKQAIDEGHFAGPRIYPAGAAIGMTSGHADYRSLSVRPRLLGGPGETEVEHLGMSVFADGVPEVLAASRTQFRKGSVFLKMFTGGAVSGLRDPLDIAEYSFEEIKAAADEAKRWNTYLAVHAYTDRSVSDALKAGAMSIEHATLISEKTMKEVVEKDAFLSLQTGVFLAPAPDSFTPAQKKRQKEAAEGLDVVMRLARKHRAKIAFGSDFVGTPETKKLQLQEFTNRLTWFTEAEILRQATATNGELMALSGERNPYPGKLGVIEEGALADLLLFDRNPLEDLKIVTRPEEHLDLIMKDGKIYKNNLK